jgi:Secretion system C-terminal sorting domain
MKKLLKKITFIVIVVLFSIKLSAQTAPDTTWTQMYSGGMYDWAWAVLETSDGGYIMVGDTESAGAGSWDIGLIKTDVNGITEWTQTYGGLYEERGQSIQHTSDGGYIILGSTSTYGAGSSDLWLVKIDNLGNEEWTQTFGGSSYDWGYYVEQTSDNGYIIVGSIDPDVYWVFDVFLIKTDSEGNTEWSKTFDNGAHDTGHCVKQTSDGGYILTGYTYLESSDLWLIKTDENGDIEWDNTYGDTELPEQGYSVIQSGDEYIVTGFAKPEYETSIEYDVWILKTDIDGNEIWSKTYGGTEDDRSYDIKSTLDNNYIIAGFTNSCSEVAPPNYYMWLLKIDNEGDTLWTKTIGDETFNRSRRARSVIQISDGSYVVAGDRYAGLDDGEYNFYLVKLNSEGGVIIDEKIQSEQSTLCYPNPTTGIFTIENSLDFKNIVGLEIININGQIIYSSENFKFSDKIDLSNQTKGVYLVNIKTKNQTYTDKIILK